MHLSYCITCFFFFRTFILKVRTFINIEDVLNSLLFFISLLISVFLIFLISFLLDTSLFLTYPYYNHQKFILPFRSFLRKNIRMYTFNEFSCLTWFLSFYWIKTKIFIITKQKWLHPFRTPYSSKVSMMVFLKSNLTSAKTYKNKSA